MKTLTKFQLFITPPRRGFALVVTLSLMILLTLIAVGLLSLTSISLRTASQSDAMSVARANARMALMLAIGDLQKNAGPDQRITARADVFEKPNDKITNPRLTGVWKSRNTIAQPPTAADYDPAAKETQFLGWLVSTKNQSDLRSHEFAGNAAVDPVRLWDVGTLGTSAPAQDLIDAGKVQVSGKTRGCFSWAVMDEGIKARLNTPYDTRTSNDGTKTAQLGSGERPGIEFMDGLNTLTRDKFEISGNAFDTMKKGVTPLNAQLAAETLAPAVTAKLKEHTHDLTVFSTGLFTDVTTGGLKEDFHLLCEYSTLPAPYLGKGVYASRLGIPAPPPVPPNPYPATSDPSWGLLCEFAKLYRQGSALTKVSNIPVLKATAPAGWSAATNVSQFEQPIVNPGPPPGPVLMPTIAKVQVVFTLMARDMYGPYPLGAVPVPASTPQLHNPWGNRFMGTPYDYMLHLVYTPVVTLHNPYNVALEFETLKVEFINVPFAIRVFRNDLPQTTDLVPLDYMYADTASADGTKSKPFAMTMKTKGTSGPGSTTFQLLPGEVKLFSPYINPNLAWKDDFGPAATLVFRDYTGKSNVMDGMPGWPGDGIGFDVDPLCPEKFRKPGDEYEQIDVAGATATKDKVKRDSTIPLRAQDDLYVEFAPYSIDKANGKFTVKMSAKKTPADPEINTGAIELNYESTRGLQEFLLKDEKDLVLRYPKSGTVKATDILDHHSIPLKDYAKAKPFAIVSAQAKTTYGGYDADMREGRHATKPWVFAHAPIGASTAKVVSEHPANHSHEIDLIRLERSEDLNDLYLEIDSFDRSNFITGHTSQKGSKLGVMYDIPLAPIQSLASLNGANPGGLSGYVPRFAQPIGNSWASPMLPADVFMEMGSTGTAPMYDHSFMLNTALYDHFYFSGLATQSGGFSAGKSTINLIRAFSESQPMTLSDPRIALHLPDGARAADMPGKLAAANRARHTQVAAWQKMDGAFNINSTSVDAWKAMLASIHSSDAIYNKITGPAASALTTLPKPADNEALISRLRLPVTTSSDPGSYWLGPRVLNDAQLDKLAKAIVDQVRERGPFLSLSEFVNRQLVSGTGDEDKDKRKYGALQHAIELSGINKDNIPDQINSFSGYEIDKDKVSTYLYDNPDAGTGHSAEGAPGAVSQADILTVLGNAATPRSDTFTIRAYGEARDSAGNVTATAYCEAVVQRQPEYLDPTDPVDAVPQPLAPATTTCPIISSPANNTFGRKFGMVSFRWLAKSEV